MKLVSVDRALKKLQKDTLIQTLEVPRLCQANFSRYNACTKQLADKKGSSFKALCTGTSFIKNWSLLSEAIIPRI